MAEIPVYQPSIPVNAPGTPQARIEPMTPASSSAGIYEAQAGLGKKVEDVSSTLRTHMLMQDRIEAQQDGYDAAAKYNQKLQDVVAEEKQNNTGMNAKGGEVRLKQLINGIPASPGRPGVPPLRAEFSSSLSPLALKSFDRTAAAHETVAHGQIINHVLTQTNKAMEQNSTAAIGTQIDHGNNIHFPAEMKDAQKEFGKIIDEDEWLKREHTPEDLAKMKQGFLDKQAEAAITARAHEDYKTAQKLFDSAKDGLSPGMRTHLQESVIDPAKVSQFADAGTLSILKNDTLRIKGDMKPDEMQIDENKALLKTREMVAKEHLPAGHDSIVIDRIMSNVKAENSRMDTEEKQKKDAAILAIQKMSKDPNATLPEARKQFVESAKFMRGQTHQEVDDFAVHAFTKDPLSDDNAWKSVPAQVRGVLDSYKASQEYLSKFPYPADKKKFDDTVKLNFMNSGIRTEDQARKIISNLMKEEPTGAARFWFGIGKKTEPIYKTEAQIRGDEKIRESLGNTPNEQQVKAIMHMNRDGFPVTPLNVATFIKNNPGLVK